MNFFFNNNSNVFSTLIEKKFNMKLNDMTKEEIESFVNSLSIVSSHQKSPKLPIIYETSSLKNFVKISNTFEFIEGQGSYPVIFYAFNHVSSRFDHAFDKNMFNSYRQRFPESKFIILEYGLGDEKSAVNNPQEKFEFEGCQVIKFWYNTSYEFVAPQNNTSQKKLDSIFNSQKN